MTAAIKTKGWWHGALDGNIVVSRRWPPVFDIVAETDIAVRNPKWLAQQIRQDVWRALQHLRGFAPAVMVGADGTVRAGGALTVRPAAKDVERLQAVLDDPARRARWVRNAGGKPDV